MTKTELKQNIKILLTKKSTPFFANLLEKITHSFANLSLENPKFFELVCLFDSINDPNSLIYWDLHYSRCFDDLVRLNVDELHFLQDYLNFCEQNLSQVKLQLCQDNFLRAKTDIAWLLDLDQFYQNLVKNFSHITPLSKQEIIHPIYQGNHAGQERYFINLLADKSWKTLISNDWLGFLQGGDFFYLSDTAYAVAVPACIKFCIDDFRQQTNNYPFEYLCILLEDTDRAISAELKKLMADFLQIWSHPAC